MEEEFSNSEDPGPLLEGKMRVLRLRRTTLLCLLLFTIYWWLEPYSVYYYWFQLLWQTTSVQSKQNKVCMSQSAKGQQVERKSQWTYCEIQATSAAVLKIIWLVLLLWTSSPLTRQRRARLWGSTGEEVMLVVCTALRSHTLKVLFHPSAAVASFKTDIKYKTKLTLCLNK